MPSSRPHNNTCDSQGDADLTPHTGVNEEETRKFGLFLMPVKNTESDQREIDCVFVVFGRDSDGQPTGHSLRDSYVYQPNTQIGYGEPDLLKDESNSQSYIQNDEVRPVGHVSCCTFLSLEFHIII